MFRSPAALNGLARALTTSSVFGQEAAVKTSSAVGAGGPVSKASQKAQTLFDKENK